MFILILGGLFEVIMVYCLNKAEGFKNKLWSLLVIICSACSLSCLSYSMKIFDVGIAYSIWVAFGSIGSILLGGLIFDEKITGKQLFFMLLIIIAVIGLKIC